MITYSSSRLKFYRDVIGLNVLPQISYVEILTPRLKVLGGWSLWEVPCRSVLVQHLKGIYLPSD